MMKKQYLLIGLVMSLLLFNIACNNTANATDLEAEHDDEHMDEELDHMHVAPPKEFAGLANPFADDEAAIAAGKQTFDTLCATCHGPEGNGDGVAAEGLDPKPASLSDRMMMRELSDGYLFWRVSKGGTMEPFNSAMPPWESGLSEDERWQVVSYIRTLADNGNGHMDGNDHMGDDQHDDQHNEGK